MIKTIDICNTTSSDVTATVYLVPNGDSANSSNILVPAITLRKEGMFQWTGSQVLEEGGTIQAVSSITGVTINISGGDFI